MICPDFPESKEFSCVSCQNEFYCDMESELYTEDGDRLCTACAGMVLNATERTDRRYTEAQLPRVREFNALRGQLIIEMLEGNCGNISLDSGTHTYDVHMGLGSWMVSFYGDNSEGKFIVEPSDEERKVYNTAAQFDDFCAQYGVKR